MKVRDFSYNLPKELIAQEPLPSRDRSRLMVIRRETCKISEARFFELPELLESGDLLVINNTRVRPLRLSGYRPTGGRVEITLTARMADEDAWECLIKGGKPRRGSVIELADGHRAEVLGKSEAGIRLPGERGAPLWKVRIQEADVHALLESRGLPPLPPYIRREPGQDPSLDRERYQTIYAEQGEASAAPTAGLHFTKRLLEKIRGKGVDIKTVQLDVSYGTFAPVRTQEVEDHRMHPEHFHLPGETAEAIERARARRGRVVAVGTTVVRTLEHCADESGRVRPGAGTTGLFIYPGYKFRAVDAVLTNFHMPGSTLIMLVCAFAGRELVLRAYDKAVAEGYRFLSYGDAMLIL